MPQFKAIKGTRDILPPESALWNWFEATARRVMETFAFHEIRLPIFEEAELFARSVGSDTDIVSKEMYTFVASGGRDFGAQASKKSGPATGGIGAPVMSPELEGLVEAALRPEATASVIRAYIEHGMHTNPGLTKLYYVGPMFRRERPQKGRYRQFYQIGAEVLGQSDAPAIDAELIEMLVVLLAECQIEKWTLLVNSIGCRECRPKYVGHLRAALQEVKDRLGPDSQRRIETNPLRVLDSKLQSEQAVINSLPRIGDYLCDECRKHFAALKEQLKLRGIAYEENWRLVRGLDYYMRTTFEITSPVLGAQNALVGGGRYDGLAELLGGPPTKGTGFALGTDRFIDAIREAGKIDAARPVDVFVAWLGAVAYAAAAKLARKMRAAGLSVELPPEEMKLKKSLGLADKLGARYALLIGENEIKSGKFLLKRLADAQQIELGEAELIPHLKPANRG